MSSHFNYEIDEKHLGARLKEMRLQYNEQAWTRFETYTDGLKKTYTAPVLPKFSLNINRSVILPIVFGSAIILFSMLLYNFVSIKKPAQVAAIKKAAIVTPLVKNEVPAPVEEKEKNVATVDPTALKIKQKMDSVAAAMPAINNPAPTPTVAAAVPEVKQHEPPSWTVIETGPIYRNPNIKSPVIGNSQRNQSLKAIEETVYFIKATFSQNGRTDTGYIRKSQLAKAGQAIQVYSSVPRQKRKAEVLESIQVPASLPTAGSSEKEPELK
jgi:hypothetical protein